MKSLIFALIAGVAAGAGLLPRAAAQTAASDVAQFSQIVRNYNLVTFGNANLASIGSDTEGPLAVGGNLSLSGSPLVNLAQFQSSSDPALYVAGQLSIANQATATLNHGYASLPGMTGLGSWDSTQKRYTTPSANGGGLLSTINAYNPVTNPRAGLDPRSNPAPASWNFAALKTQAVAVSNSLAGLSATGTISVANNSLVFDAGGHTGIVVFDLDASLLNGNTYNGSQTFSNLSFTIPTSTEFVVNVFNANGKTLFGTGSGINFNPPGGTAGASQLLWNFVTGASDISTTLGNGGEFYGSVLAPMVNLANASNAPLNGQIVADSIVYANAPLYYTAFVAIPEPAAGAAVLGLLALAFARRFRRRALSA